MFLFMLHWRLFLLQHFSASFGPLLSCYSSCVSLGLLLKPIFVFFQSIYGFMEQWYTTVTIIYWIIFFETTMVYGHSVYFYPYKRSYFMWDQFNCDGLIGGIHNFQHLWLFRGSQFLRLDEARMIWENYDIRQKKWEPDSIKIRVDTHSMCGVRTWNLNIDRLMIQKLD